MRSGRLARTARALPLGLSPALLARPPWRTALRLAVAFRHECRRDEPASAAPARSARVRGRTLSNWRPRLRAVCHSSGSYFGLPVWRQWPSWPRTGSTRCRKDPTRGRQRDSTLRATVPIKYPYRCVSVPAQGVERREPALRAENRHAPPHLVHFSRAGRHYRVGG